MKPIRFGVVGVSGVIGGTHVRAIQQVEGAEIVAVTDIDQNGAREVARATGCELTKNYEWLVKRGDIDAVSLCTPHAQHFQQTLDALRARKHVLVERPLATTVAEADKIVAAAEKHERKVGVVFQYRYRPAVRAAKNLMLQGELGRIYRVTLVHTAFKTQHFYDSAPWRGTWSGEGGGVTIHQGLPYLDLMAYLVGMPSAVTAWSRTLAHDIEVEDTCSALAELPDGAQCMIHFNSFQIPGESYLEIVGDRGTIRIEGDDLKLFRPAAPLRQFIATDTSHLYSCPQCAEQAVPMENTAGTHYSVVWDFVNALRTDQSPFCDAREAAKSLEIANAILVSSCTGKPVALPLKRSAIRRVMRQLAGPPDEDTPEGNGETPAPDEASSES